MGVNKKGFAAVNVSGVKVPKATVTGGKCEISLKLDVKIEDAMQLTSFAHRNANLKMTLTEIDPELPMPAEDK